MTRFAIVLGAAFTFAAGASQAAPAKPAADESASVDYGASSAFGLQAYLHILDFTGTDVDISVQSSSDNGAVDTWADITGAVFTTATGTGWERVQTARNATIERYLRVAATGTFSSVTFAVIVVRNPVTVIF